METQLYVKHIKTLVGHCYSALIDKLSYWRKVGSQTSESDNFYPIVAHHAQQIVNEKGYVSPIDVFLALGKLSPEQHEAWRSRQVQYLEQLLRGNLNKLKRINRCLRRWALSLGLKPRETVYKSWGKGQKVNLRFSKSGDPSIERAYATHYVDVELMRQRRGRSTGGSAVVSPSRRNIYASAKPKGR